MKEKKKQLWQVVKFTLFSASAGIIQVGSFALIELFIQDYWIPYLSYIARKPRSLKNSGIYAMMPESMQDMINRVADKLTA